MKYNTVKVFKDLADKSIKIIEDRDAQYGEAHNNFQDIANEWNLYLGRMLRVKGEIVLGKEDVAMMMGIFKDVRIHYAHLKGKTSEDSLIDGTNYRNFSHKFVKEKENLQEIEKIVDKSHRSPTL